MNDATLLFPFVYADKPLAADVKPWVVEGNDERLLSSWIVGRYASRGEALAVARAENMKITGCNPWFGFYEDEK